jgi:hypothetical protein
MGLVEKQGKADAFRYNATTDGFYMKAETSVEAKNG